MLSFTKFLVEKKLGGPRNHEELLAHYNDPESRMLIGQGIHPGTLDTLPVHLRPGYSFAASDVNPAPDTPPPATNGMKWDRPYSLMKSKDNAGGKDKWGRTVFNPWDHPQYLSSQDAAINKGKKSLFPGIHHPETRPAYRLANDGI